MSHIAGEIRSQRHTNRLSLTENVVSGLVAIFDTLMIAAPGICAYLAYAESGAADRRYFTAILVLSGLSVGLAWGLGAYASLDRIVEETPYRDIVHGFLLAVCVVLALGFGLKVSESYSRVWLVTWIGSAFLSLVAGRYVVRTVLSRIPRIVVRRLAIVGSGEQARRLLSRMRHVVRNNIVGIYDDIEGDVPDEIEGVKVVGTVQQLIWAIRSGEVDDVILALPWSAELRFKEIFGVLKDLPVNIRISPDLISFHLAEWRPVMIGGVPAIQALERPIAGWSYIVKTVFDRVTAVLAIVILSPMFLLISLAVWLDTRGPIFFVQDRLGFNDRVFRVFKFRTMFSNRCDPDAAVQATRGDDRVTWIGRLLRRTSLDELPQLFNVLRGDMSLVGPRPHAVGMTAEGKALNEAVARYAARHRVKPGMTGWAQVNGYRGNADSVEHLNRRVEYDLWYIDHWSFILDVWIIICTVGRVITDRNAY